MHNIPVLIVGGGPVGLTASILLSRHGVRSLLVERHPGTSIVPKARGINARTMEMYRQSGVEAGIRAAGLAPQSTGLVVWTESLAGREIERRIPGRMSAANRGASEAGGKSIGFTGLRVLRGMGAIRTVYVAGDRRDHYAAETELRRARTAGFTPVALFRISTTPYTYLSKRASVQSPTSPRS